MEFRVLGPLEVRYGERSLPLAGAKLRALLALLLLKANQVVSRARDRSGHRRLPRRLRTRTLESNRTVDAGNKMRPRSCVGGLLVGTQDVCAPSFAVGQPKLNLASPRFLRDREHRSSVDVGRERREH